jgi:hypothetical protein
MLNGGHTTVDLTAIVIGSQSSSSHARSGLPDAPVVERPVASRPARPRSATAALLMRMAVRLDPGYERESRGVSQSAGTA